MNHDFLLIKASTEAPDLFVFWLGIACAVGFFLLGLLIGGRLLKRCGFELERLEEDTRKFSQAFKKEEKTFQQHQDTISSFVDKDKS